MREAGGIAWRVAADSVESAVAQRLSPEFPSCRYGTVLAGSYATMLPADLGAQVTEATIGIRPAAEAR